MHVFNQETLIQILEQHEGVDLVSYGKPRDAFELPVEVPHWTSGYGGKYEMRHTHVPAGAMVAVGSVDIEELDLSDQQKLKDQLKIIDMYPTGHSGDFTGTDLKTLRQWFTSRSRLDNEVNNQSPISHVKKLTPAGLGAARYNDLVNYLTDNMNIFKNPDVKGIMVPADRKQRKQIVQALLDGLSKAVRYTRLDDPAKAYQITGQVLLEGDNDSAIHLHLTEAAKILVLRTNKNGTKNLTPLDRAFIGRSYLIADGQPLGERGSVDIGVIEMRSAEIENEGKPTVPHPYVRVPRLDMSC